MSNKRLCFTSFRSNGTCLRGTCCGRSIASSNSISGGRSWRRFYSQKGRPSIDPELMIRMLIVGYCFGIRSERRLCEEVHLNLAYRWFVGLGLHGAVSDHSTFSKNRHGRFRESDLLRNVFETTVRGAASPRGWSAARARVRCQHDQGRLHNRQRSVPGSEWQAPETGEPCRASGSISRCSTMPLFGGATPVVPKFHHRTPIRARVGPVRTAGSPFFAYCTTT